MFEIADPSSMDIWPGEERGDELRVEESTGEQGREVWRQETRKESSAEDNQRR